MSLFCRESNEFLNNQWLLPFEMLLPGTHTKYKAFKNKTYEQHMDKNTLLSENQSDSPHSGMKPESGLKESQPTENTNITSVISPEVEKSEPQEEAPSIVGDITTTESLIIEEVGMIFENPELKGSNSFEINKDSGDTEVKLDFETKKQNDDEENLLLFHSLDLSEEEKLVSADMIQSTEQARSLFLFTYYSWVKRKETLGTLKDHPMEYTNAIIDLSELYSYLAFYEENIDSQYSVQKLRADALETMRHVLQAVRPQGYMAANIVLLRELADVQLEMLSLNLQRLYTVHENESQNKNIAPDFILHKMEALAHIYSRLENFADSLRHGAEFGDGLNDVSAMEMPEYSFSFQI
ncbi:KIF-binding protein-like [Periplaneta americana]